MLLIIWETLSQTEGSEYTVATVADGKDKRKSTLTLKDVDSAKYEAIYTCNFIYTNLYTHSGTVSLKPRRQFYFLNRVPICNYFCCSYCISTYIIKFIKTMITVAVDKMTLLSQIQYLIATLDVTLWHKTYHNWKSRYTNNTIFGSHMSHKKLFLKVTW